MSFGSDLREQLKSNVMEVKFTKVNGEDRTMKCTLSSQYLPASDALEPSATPPNEKVIAVWNLDTQGWRSFRTESVYSASPVFLTESGGTA